jgi:hypothetical protein
MDAFARRVLALTAVDDEPHRWRKIRIAWLVVSLHVAVRFTLAMWFAGWPRYLLVLPAVGFALGQRRRLMRPLAILFTLFQAVRFARTYPDVSNHYFVETLCVAVFAAVELSREEERALCLQMLGWLTVLVFFVSGLQKLLHGCYFEGQYLGYMVSSTDRFRRFFAPLLPADELARLAALRDGPPSGPYRVGSLLFVVISNAVWLGEMLTAVGLLIKRVRPLALAGGLALMAGILGSSNELFFDTLFLNLLLLFARRELILWALPLTFTAYGYYLLVGFNVVKGGFVW